jgi:3-dehydroquinate dehydratase I
MKLPSPRRPWIVAALADARHLSRDAVRAAEEGADLLEVRADAFPQGARSPEALTAALKAVRRAARRPLLLTLRHRREGGGWTRSEAERLSLFKETMGAVDAVDVEGGSTIAARVVRAARKAGKWTVLSHHDFKRTPADAALRRLAARFKRSGADVFKVAAAPRSKTDVARLMDFCAALPGRRAFISMGLLGKESRLSPARWGSCLTYGFIGKPAAPGQVSVKKLARALR